MAPKRKSVMKTLLKQPKVRSGKVHANVVHSHAVMLQHFNGSEEEFQQAIADGAVAEREEGIYFVNPTNGATKMPNVMKAPKKAPMKTMKAHAKAHATVQKKPAAVLKNQLHTTVA